HPVIRLYPEITQHTAQALHAIPDPAVSGAVDRAVVPAGDDVGCAMMACRMLEGRNDDEIAVLHQSMHDGILLLVASSQDRSEDDLLHRGNCFGGLDGLGIVSWLRSGDRDP